MSEQDLCQCPKCGRMHPLMGFAMPENVREQLAAELKERSSQPLPAEFLGMAKKIDALTAALTEAENAARASVTPDAAAIRREALTEMREWCEGMRNYAERIIARKSGDLSIYSQIVDDFRMAIAHCDALADQPLPVQPEGWCSDMEAAPKDVPVLLYCPTREPITNRERIELGPAHTSTGSHHAWATHWRLLPAAPEPKT